MRLRVATCRALPEPDVDAAPLAAALVAAGVDATLLAWDDPDAPWDEPGATILRSTWNYALDVDGFLAWVGRAAAAGPVWNPPAVIAGNVHKRYLLDLAARGVPVVPTVLVDRGAATPRGRDAALGDALADAWARHAPAPDDRLVIKPEVGAGSLGARVFGRAEAAAAEGHLAALTTGPTAGAALIQPYLRSVDGYGERSLVWIDGALTHAIRKSPRFAGDDERIDGPLPITDDERAVAAAALAPLADQLLYARVDLARDDAGQPRVMELELVEPSLFFARGGDAAARYVAGLRRRLALG